MAVSVSGSQLIKLIKSVTSLVLKKIKVTAMVCVFYGKRRLKSCHSLLLENWCGCYEILPHVYLGLFVVKGVSLGQDRETSVFCEDSLRYFRASHSSTFSLCNGSFATTKTFPRSARFLPLLPAARGLTSLTLFQASTSFFFQFLHFY